MWHRVLSCINTAGWLIAVLKLGTCFFNISLYTVALILPCSLTRGPVPVTEIMPNPITLPPPNLTLLLVHWGDYRSLGLRWTNLLSSQPKRLNLTHLKWTQSSVHKTCSVANFNRLILFFLEMKAFVEATRLFKFISLSLGEIVCLDILIARFALGLLEIAVTVVNPFFNSLPIRLSSLTLVFLILSDVFLASHDPGTTSFL